MTPATDAEQREFTPHEGGGFESRETGTQAREVKNRTKGPLSMSQDLNRPVEAAETASPTMTAAETPVVPGPSGAPTRLTDPSGRTAPLVDLGRC
jgi:hypothetical protein